MKVIKNSIFLLCTVILTSCATKPPMPTKVTSSFVVDDNYILMSDVYYLTNGMPYSKISEILKVPPYEIYSNIEDNCIIIKYLGKRALRIHDTKINNVQPPLDFYLSSDTKNLTYGEFFELHVILDGSQKSVRSFFTNTDVSVVSQVDALMKRAKLVCSSPEKTKSFLQEWFSPKPQKTIKFTEKKNVSSSSNMESGVSSSSVVNSQSETVRYLKRNQILPLVAIANKYKNGRISKDKALQLFATAGYDSKQVVEFNKSQFRIEDLLK